MHVPIRLAALAVVLTAIGCSEPPGPSSSDDPASGALSAAAGRGAAAAAEQARLERLARRIAIALNDPAFRAQLKRSLDASPFRERKLPFQRLLRAENGRGIQQMARLNGERPLDLAAELDAAVPLELYLPVPEHRERWSGGSEVLVATAREDHTAPVAFDVKGRRQILSADAPPAIPVLALVPQEADFDATAEAICDVDQCGTGGGGGSIPAPGLYMTQAHFVETFEGWLKGSPEFEVHILGQSGATDSLKTYQCSGERASGPSYFDQNGTDWTGNVLLFTQAQINDYKAQHPGQSTRVFIVEDDDTACRIRTDNARFVAVIKAVDAAYKALTGGRDTTTGLSRYWKHANIFQKLLVAVASFINSNDELVGNAVESVVVGEYHPGANWVVKGENNKTNGWINLQMR